jgi:hypothetical protein
MSVAFPDLASARFELGFVPRAEPLVSCAALALNDAAVLLARRLLLLTDEQLHGLRGATSTRLVLVLGSADALPWVDGIAYFGRDPLAPSLLLPTALTPNLPLQLVERAILARAGKAGAGGPFLLCAFPRRVIDSSAARNIDRATLTAWLTTTSEASTVAAPTPGSAP